MNLCRKDIEMETLIIVTAVILVFALLGFAALRWGTDSRFDFSRRELENRPAWTSVSNR
jgi:Tfp pilus assembly protein PilX